MTARTPAVVKFEYHDWRVINGGSADLEVTGVRLSADWDRTPFITGVITLAPVPDATWKMLDPREEATIQGYIQQRTLDGSFLGALPYDSFNPEGRDMRLVIRTARRNHLTGEVTVAVAGRESLVSDKRRIASGTRNTGAEYVSSLVQWSLLDIFGSFFAQQDTIATTTPIPAGDRRLMYPGETHEDLLQPELDAIGCRLYDSWGILWGVHLRDSTHPETLKLATYADAPADADPIVTEIFEEVTRDDGWADGVLVKYQPPGGTITYHASGAGVNTRGIVINRNRVAPAGNTADQIVTRTIVRGYDLNITARIRFDAPFAEINRVRPQPVIVYTPAGTLEAKIRAIEWDTETGLMTLRAQSGDSL